MTTSGVYSFSMTRDQLIAAALRKLAVLGDGLSPTATQYTNGTEALNAMLKTFTAKGMPLWVITETDIPLTATRTYTCGTGQTVNVPAPLKVFQAVLKDTTALTGVPLNEDVHYDYNLLTNTGVTGTPNIFWYEPLNQTGVLHIYPTPDTNAIANKYITITYQRPFQDMVNTGDTLDFPQWWHEAVIYGLAWRLSPDFGIPLMDRQELSKEAGYFLDEAVSFGTEEGSMFLQPDWVGRGK